MSESAAFSSSASASPAARQTHSLAIASALVTFAGSPALGGLVARRWRRAAGWLGGEILCYVGFVVVALAARPRHLWAVLAAVMLWRAAAGVDAYRQARRAARTASWRTIVLAWIVLTVAGVGAALVVRRTLVEAFQIPSASMVPTLLPGEHIFVDKRGWPVQRGDVIVFGYPPDPSMDYVKRVIAVGGDTVETTARGIVVNGQEVPSRRLDGGCPDAVVDDEERESCEQQEETLGERRYRVMRVHRADRPPLQQAPLRVPEGTVFVVGDNRDNSADSRTWGPVPLANVKGRVFCIWWSRGPSGTRWDRIDTGVR